MNSPFTGKEMQLIREKRMLTFRKEAFEYIHHTFQCQDTKEQFTTTALDDLNLSQVYNQYREKHTIPFPQEIKDTRKKYGISATKMSEILGFGVNSYRLYEEGEIPSLSNARLIQSVYDPEVFRRLVILCDKVDGKERSKLEKHIDRLLELEKEQSVEMSFENHLMGDIKPTIQTGFSSPNFEKMSEMVTFFSEKLKPYKTKLNKLLFYADFLNFKETGYSISGFRYRAIDLGPVPINFQSLFERIHQNGKIEIFDKIFENDIVGEQFIPRNAFSSSMFSAIELESLERVVLRFKEVNTKEIVDLSHEEQAWIENVKTKSIISYTTAFELKHI